MKSMRYFILIALLLSCFIVYRLYKAGRSVNKTINSQALFIEDSLVNSANDPSALVTLDTAYMPSTVSTPSQSTTVEQSKSTAPTVTPISTILATPYVATKQPKIETQKKTPSPKRTTETAEQGKTRKEASGKRYHVIIGSFSTESNARTKASDFEKKSNKKATIIQQGGYFRVCADEFELTQLATQYAQKLKQAGEDCMVLQF